MSDERTAQPIQHPDRWLNATRRGADGIERIAAVHYVASVEPDGAGNLHLTFNGPEALLMHRPLAFEPPMVELADSRAPFEFHWKLLGGVPSSG